jgi:hypothetical protein
MKALLTKNYISVDTFRGYKQDYQKHLDFKKWIAENQGKWVEIDTTCLFDNQYNTIDGKRIFDTWIDKIENDTRQGKGVCKYCGNNLDTPECTKNEKCKEYGVKMFNDKNTFFLAHPNGKDEVKEVEFNDHLKNPRFGTCYSVNGNYYRISRRSSIHFILVGTEIYITSGLGYTLLSKASLTENEKKIVKYCAEKINNL